MKEQEQHDFRSVTAGLGLLEARPSVPLAGVPQIPDDAHQCMQRLGEFGLTDEQQDRCSEVIWTQAAPEIRRRHEARLARVPLDRYFARTLDQEEI